MGTDSYERRHHNRVNFKGSASYYNTEKARQSGSKIRSAPVVDISETGALLILEHNSDMGEIITLAFKLGGRMSSAIRCQVVDVRLTNEGYLTGVEFMIVKESDSTAIKGLVNNP